MFIPFIAAAGFGTGAHRGNARLLAAGAKPGHCRDGNAESDPGDADHHAGSGYINAHRDVDAGSNAHHGAERCR